MTTDDPKITAFQVSVSAFVIVRRNDEVLLLRRCATGWHDGEYSLPAGRLEPDETLVGAAVRELREETTLEVSSEDLRLSHLIHSRTSAPRNTWLGAFFIAERWRGEPRLAEADKHDDIGWFALAALPANTVRYTRQGLTNALSGVPFSVYGW
jgi:8-oxo-dGTP pyrophosphatase MutT (NUDIX family)